MTVLSQISDAMQALVDKTAQRVVALNPNRRDAASGILWRSGLIVTADEALDDDEGIEATMPDGSVVAATLAGRDPSTDIALLRVDARSQTLESFKPAGAVKAGHLAVAVGRAGNGEIAASGVVKECGGSWRSWAGGLIDRRILLDLALDRRSHGALVIPADTVGRIAERLATSGSIARGYLGVGLHPLRGERASGAIVVRLDDNGPAKGAGILVGDILTAWNGEPIRGGRGDHVRCDASRPANQSRGCGRRAPS